MLDLDNLRPGEKVEMVIKRHWIVFIWLFISFILANLLTVLIWAIFPNEFWVLLIVIQWLVSSLIFYIQWLNVELDLFIVTNNRIIWVEQISFLNRTISEANLGQVQEVNSQTKGLLSNLLDYGSILVQTAWTASNFDMHFAPHAFANSRQILNIVDDYRDNYSGLDNVNAEIKKEGE